MVQSIRGVFGHTLLQVQPRGSPRRGTAFHRVNFVKAKLAVPGGNESGAGLLVAGKDHRAILYYQHVVGSLHHLAAGEPSEAGDMAGFVLFGSAHVDEKRGFFLSISQHGLKSGNIHVADAVFGGKRIGVGFGGG